METIEDIVREMRGIKDWRGDDVPIFTDWADRIEAAAKAEREVSRNLCNKCEAGDIKAENARLRAELAKARNCFDGAPEYKRPDFPWEY